MKKVTSLLLALLQVWLFLPGLFSHALAAENELTVMVYVCGSDLESDGGQASGDLEEMMSSGIGSTPGVSVMVATGGSRDWQDYDISSRSLQYYRLGAKEPELLKSLGQKNMGDQTTLSDFVRFSLSAAPARRYILIFWDHGGGPLYGVCNDANYHDDSLSLSELHNGLLSALGTTRLEIVAFDCCIMNCIDLCSDMAEIADYSVLSQEMVAGSGLNYDVWMKLIAKDPTVSAREIAISIADSYVEENSRGFNADTATMSVISSAAMPAVMEAANAFSAALVNRLSTDYSAIVRLRTGLTSFGEFVDEDATDLVDLCDMCDAFSALLPEESAALKAAAQQAICYNCTTKDISSYAHGLSFFLPYDTIFYQQEDILDHYSADGSAYSALVLGMANQADTGSYAITASSYTPSSFYTCDDSGSSGSFCDIWNGYYGDYCSFDDALSSCDGDIWAGLCSGGSVWDGYSSGSGLWEGYDLWSGLNGCDDGSCWEGTYWDDNIWSGYDSSGSSGPGGSYGSNGPGGSYGGLWGGLPSGNSVDNLNTGSGGPSGQGGSGNNEYAPTAGGLWASGENDEDGEPAPTAGGLWASDSEASTAAAGSIWSTDSDAAASAGSTGDTANTAGSASALNNIWAGLLNTGSDYYQPGEANQNVQPGITAPATAQTVLADASSYFSSASMTTQMIYSVQLNKTDLDNLASASGVLSMKQGDETVLLGNVGATTIDWSTGLIFSMFNGIWPTLGGQMVRAEFLYTDDEGCRRFVIPARINDLKMYLLGRLESDGSAEILGVTQGYDDSGFAIRGSVPLEAGMTIVPLFTAITADGSEKLYDGTAITVPEEGLTLSMEKVASGSYQYCFGLTDLSGLTWYTDSAQVNF